MHEQKLKNILFTLYVLHSYKKDENPSNLELKSLMINSVETIDINIINKEELIQEIKNILNFQIEIQALSTSQIIQFKIGEIRKANLSSSQINLKFVFSKNEDKVLVDIYEKEKKSITINL
ncbi:hypothetical protein EC396_11330 [Lutibacter sp. HS1-25]|uniref:hypothetical protein n=1 Tax=Lutibacter sp. HS1-25 TaxID=2485000 RepID=UPI0010139412|nr:hypothetical protein [Lutibacter sp. HS1-25]RXP52355.1 hypothetical protein EC396_11330 [Lutibacter sp. HS1-25]